MAAERRVTLRRVEPSDYLLILQWQNDPELFQWMDYERPFALEDIRDSEERAVREGYPFVIDLQGRAIGRIGLNNIRWRDRVGSLYVFVGDRDARGHGNGREAIEAILEFAFCTLNLNLVELWSLADNEKAIRLYKRVGFMMEAQLRDRSFNSGGYRDRIIMSVTAEEYRKAHRS